MRPGQQKSVPGILEQTITPRGTVLKKIFHDNAARWIPGTTAG